MARDMDPGTPLALTQEQFTALLEAVKSGQQTESIARFEQALLKTAEISATAMKRALKPENDFHPEKSAYSYPEGDRVKPRKVPTHDVLWNGYPVHQFPETWHWLELELLDGLQPGEYVVSKANDEGVQKVSVTAERDADEKISRLSVTFPGMSRDEARTAPPLVVWLHQMRNRDRSRSDTYMEGQMLFHKHVVKGEAPVAVVA